MRCMRVLAVRCWGLQLSLIYACVLLQDCGIPVRHPGRLPAACGDVGDGDDAKLAPGEAGISLSPREVLIVMYLPCILS